MSRRRSLADAIAKRAQACGLSLTLTAIERLTRHAEAVLRAPRELHLTSIVDPHEFVERHVGEALEGAAMLSPSLGGPLVDLGSGNGYPGVVLGVARPHLSLHLAEATPAKAQFLRRVLDDIQPEAVVHARAIQRAPDLAEIGPVRVFATRAMGDWERILPRLRSTLAPDGEILLWAGEAVESVRRRVAWSRFELRDRRALPGRDRSWIWRLGTAD